MDQQPQASGVSEPIPQFGGAQASGRKLPVKAIAIGAGVVVGIGVIAVVANLIMGQIRTPSTTGTQSGTQQPKEEITLTYWGLWEPTEVVQSTITEFQNKNPGVKIVYSQQSVKDYRERLQSAFTRGQGPDIFRFHNTWVPMLSNTLSTVPSSVMTAADYEKTYYPVAVSDLKTSTGYAGIPLMIDGLGLYVNTKIFSTAGKTAPTSWDDVRRIGRDLTVRGADGSIERSGVALGSAENVDHFSDILALLIMQNGGNPALPEQKSAEGNFLVGDALTFYTQFYKSDKVWDETLPNSTYAFAMEKTAMMFAPSWRAFEVKQINPNVEFAIYPVPQLPGETITWASYWVEGVSKSSKQQEMAWKFVKFLSEKETMKKFYVAAQSQRLFGEIYARQDMAAEIASDPYAGAYVNQAKNARSWYLSSRTFDNGLNDQISKYYKDAVNAVNQGTPYDQAVTPLSTGVSTVLKQYNVKTQ